MDIRADPSGLGEAQVQAQATAVELAFDSMDRQRGKESDKTRSGRGDDVHHRAEIVAEFGLAESSCQPQTIGNLLHEIGIGECKVVQLHQSHPGSSILLLSCVSH